MRSPILNPAVVAAAALLLAACGTLSERPPSGTADFPAQLAPVSQTALAPVYDTPGKRAATLQRVWQLVADRYYDPSFNGVDWTAARERHLPAALAAASDAQFYRALKAMVRELRDSHTVVLTAKESADRRRFIAPQTGAALGIVEGRAAVVAVEADSPAARAGVRAGDVVVALNGTALDEAFFERASAAVDDAGEPSGVMPLPRDTAEAERGRRLRALQRLLRGAPDAPPPSLRLTLQRAPDAAPIEVDLPVVPVGAPPRVELTRLDDGIAVLKLTRFAADVRVELRRAVEQVADAGALILDLRGNSGGDYAMYTWLAAQFMTAAREVMTSVRREGAGQRSSAVVLRPTADAFPGPIAVLTDRRTASASELMATTLVEQRNAITVGESTCGCVVAVRTEHVLPDGGGLRIAETGFVSARGRRMEGEPLAPTRLVLPTLADLRAGRDPVLEEARRLLKERLHRP
ncbi:MAG: peptidase S41 [Betaproteobacteria bacterium]|nr:MAG: peptidase S41 [Betaproteobacteria bacterium]